MYNASTVHDSCGPSALRHRAGPGHHPAQAHGGPARERRCRAGAPRDRARTLELRPAGVRVRRFARPVGAAAHGVELRAAAGTPLRRPARLRRGRVHRVRGRRREPHAAPDRRPAGLLAGRHAGVPRSGRSTARRWCATRSPACRPRSSESGATDRRARPADRAWRRGPAASAVPEPDRQRDQVPRRPSRRASRSAPSATRQAAGGSR